MKLIVSNDKKPKVLVKPGTAMKITTVSLADPMLKKPKKIGARLCGGTNTCLALIEIDPARD